MPTARDKSQVTPKYIHAVCDRLKQDKRVRRTLPIWGRLHIDRQLPFVCIYRRSPGREDEGTERLVLGEASYLLATGERSQHNGLSSLVRQISTTLADIFGSFLLIQIWTGPKRFGEDAVGSTAMKPEFRIFTPQREGLSSTIARFERALKRIVLFKQHADVSVFPFKHSSLPGFRPFLSNKELSELGVHFIGVEIAPVFRDRENGVEIAPVFRDRENGQLYPLVLKSLQHGFAAALKRCVYEFSRAQTTHFPSHYHAMGRRAMVKAVWEVDRQLAELSNSFDLLLSVTPTNTNSAWNEFRKSRFEKAPEFLYRRLTVEPALLKRMLYEIPIERIEDPIIAGVFQEKQEELDSQITLLSDRWNSRFLHSSIRLFGGVDTDTATLAMKFLTRLPSRTRDDSKSGYATSEEFAQRAREEIQLYRAQYAEFTAEVEVRDDIVGLLVSHGNLLVGGSARIPSSRAEALLHHEVGTHLLTYYNGRAQPFKQLYIGLAGYEELQEGLAVLSEYFCGGLSRPRLRLLASRVRAVHSLIEGASFIETFRELHNTLDYGGKTAFTIAMRVHRGGGLTKDAVYLRGLVQLLLYLKNNGRLDTLFLGKYNICHIPIINELKAREVLLPAPLIPRYFQDANINEKLQEVRACSSPYDLIKKGTRK